MTDCNITTNFCVTTYHSLCLVNLLFVGQNCLSKNGLIKPIEPHLFRENWIVELSMNKIALWISVDEDDWTAERVIIASTVETEHP